MINPSEPSNWKGLQSDVAQIMSECGFNVETEKNITIARGEVEIDVFAEDPKQTPRAVYLCECKHWNTNVPQTEVHAFRTVLNDFGANFGLMISKIGFQEGAFAAAEHTNLKLLSWQQFQELFAEQWYREYMVKKLLSEIKPLADYTEPINTRVFQKADALPPESQEQFRALRRKYETLAFFVLQLCYGNAQPELPVIEHLPPLITSDEEEIIGFPEDILQANTLRGLLNSIVKHLRIGIAEFDEVFGERA